MFSYIDQLRKRPFAERRQVANTITVVIVLAIAALWLLYTFVMNVAVVPSEKEPAPIRDSGVIQGPYGN